MSCSPEILLFLEECEAQETEERRAKFIKEEVETYRRRASSPTSQDTSLIDEAREEVGNQRNDELLCWILDEETRDAANTEEIPEGIVKWKGESLGRVSGDTYSAPAPPYSPEESLSYTKYNSVGVSDAHIKEVCVKALEIMSKATWLPNVSQPTPRSGKYFLNGASGESGFISWTEGDKVCYVSSLDGNILLQTAGNPVQYNGFKGRGCADARRLLGTALLDYFAPRR